MFEIARLRSGRNAPARVGAFGKAARIVSFSDLLVVAGGRKAASKQADHRQETRTPRKISISIWFGLFGTNFSKRRAVQENYRKNKVYTNFVLYLVLISHHFARGAAVNIRNHYTRSGNAAAVCVFDATNQRAGDRLTKS